MQRRLNLAMALVHDPEILVLDEPEAGLDPQSRVLVREYIKSLAHRRTIILTTHNMDEADRMANRVAILDHGRLLTVDTPEALKRTVGEGDVLEIELLNDTTEQAVKAIIPIVPQVYAANHTLVIRVRSVVELLPLILDALPGVNASPGEICLRANSLEDVFLSSQSSWFPYPFALSGCRLGTFPLSVISILIGTMKTFQNVRFWLLVAKIIRIWQKQCYT
jgi:ABC-2 type transport system ATP-binding protein